MSKDFPYQRYNKYDFELNIHVIYHEIHSSGGGKYTIDHQTLIYIYTDIYTHIYTYIYIHMYVNSHTKSESY